MSSGTSQKIPYGPQKGKRLFELSYDEAKWYLERNVRSSRLKKGLQSRLADCQTETYAQGVTTAWREHRSHEDL